ncbi:hypothetical protein DF3PB_5100002 [uncultured Defluviicoccus sp.]|uniref:Uncharacterized protein n=1 Tax=metagenome TaxID=256318 RepID=A0A380TI43_9ZZZZ|nr:hypothetical protein DF3PB_5100002 [uncultured Defluviicoccus sp.]
MRRQHAQLGVLKAEAEQRLDGGLERALIGEQADDLATLALRLHAFPRLRLAAAGPYRRRPVRAIVAASGGSFVPAMIGSAAEAVEPEQACDRTIPAIKGMKRPRLRLVMRPSTP